jgi:hypothetical protein
MTLYRCLAGRCKTFSSESTMDPDARRRLIEKTSARLEEGSTLSAVSREDFFEGDPDEASIGAGCPKDKQIGLAGINSHSRQSATGPTFRASSLN